MIINLSYFILWIFFMTYFQVFGSNDAQQNMTNKSQQIIESNNSNRRQLIAAYPNLFLKRVAGTGTVGDSGNGGSPLSATINAGNIWIDRRGNIYIPQSNYANIRRINITQGTISLFGGTGVSSTSFTVARPITSTNFYLPYALLGDTAGSNLWICDQFRIWEYSFAGGGTSGVGTIVGTSTAGFSGDGGPGSSAQVNNPRGFWVTTGRVFYIADSNNCRIRRYLRNSPFTMSTFAGSATCGFLDSVAATSSQLNNPYSVYADTSNRVFVADYGNNRVRRIVTGIITTIAGNGNTGTSGETGPATNARLTPVDVKGDTLGNIFIVDTSYRVLVVTGTQISRFVGGTQGYTATLTDATQASLQGPLALWIDTRSNVYISDNSAIYVAEVQPFPTSQPSTQPTSKPSNPSGMPTSQPTKQPFSSPSSQPSGQPSSSPSGQPTRVPILMSTPAPTTGFPTCTPSRQPTSTPSSQPTAQPTNLPNAFPTSMPSGQPSAYPSAQPSGLPSGYPTTKPTGFPSSQPTGFPSSQPSATPSAQPSTRPSCIPSGYPSSAPSAKPSCQPSGSPSAFPTNIPSSQPSLTPSSSPTASPSTQPSSLPTGLPSSQPTAFPSSQPSSKPSRIPSVLPTGVPSNQPTSQPTSWPSSQPSCSPSGQPVSIPTGQPSRIPTAIPSGSPTDQPTSSPSSFPSSIPSGQPTSFPSSRPSSQPSSQPSTQPTVQPSGVPSSRPSAQPSTKPSSVPSCAPSTQPTSLPSAQPSSCPSSDPSSNPTRTPTGRPSTQPSDRPSGQPTAQPSGSPSSKPSGQPSSRPTGQPSNNPSSQPSAQPSSQPSGAPSCTPSSQPTTTPTIQPTAQPSRCPTSQPTSTPSEKPTIASSVRIKTPIVFESSITDSEVSIQFTNPGIFLTSPTDVFLELSLTSSPVVMNGSSGFTEVRLIPNKFTIPINLNFEPFTLSSALIAGSPGTYLLSVNIYSLDFRVTYATARQIQILSINTEPPLPILQKAQFAEDGSYILLEFDAPTNTNEDSYNQFPCASLFDFTGLNSSTCYWQDDRTIQIYQETTDSSNLLSIGHNVTMKPSPSLKAKCSITPTYCQTWQASRQSQAIMIEPPPMPILPNIEISAPLFISPCQSLTIDLTSSTGGGGRDWRNITIIALPLESIPMTLINSLNQFLQVNYTFSPPSAIPPSYLMKGTIFSFRIELCNFLSACNDVIYAVNISSNQDALIPAVLISGQQSLSIYTRYTLPVRSNAFTTDCLGIDSYDNLQYNWTITNVKLNAVVPQSILKYIAGQNSPVFNFPSYFLPPGTAYFLQLTVTSTISSVASTSQVITITVQRGNLVPIINGGNSQVVEYQKSGVIDASFSYDEDINPLISSGKNAGLLFEWTCLPSAFLISANCSSFFYFPNGFKAARLSLYPWNILSINSSFALLLQIRDDRTARVASTTISISVTTNLLNRLSIVTPPSSLVNVPTGTSLTILADMEIYRNCKAVWSTNPTISLNSATTTTPSSLSFAIGKDQSFNLRIRPNILPERSTILFTLACGAQSMTSITVTTNGSPIPGQFKLSPLLGYELLIRYTFSAKQWMDPDLPLSYQFGFISPATDSKLVTVVRTPSTAVRTVLPAGLNTHQNRINCSLEVFDILNASRVMYTWTKVLPLTGENKEEAIADYIVQSTSSSTFLSNLDEQRTFISVASTVLNYMNCTVTVNCSSLHRSPCRKTPNTCGACLPGYHGDQGDRNTPCESIQLFQNLTASSLSSGLSGRCAADSDCNLKVQYCDPVNKTCSFFAKRCPLDCSFHGNCRYQYLRTGLPVSSCSIADLTCEAVCSCDSGFTGLDCSVNQTMLPRIQASHSVLVHVLQNLTISDNPTPQTIESWSAALNSIVSNPSYIPPKDIDTVQSIALTTVSMGMAYDVSADKLAGVLNAMDNIATLSAYLGEEKNASSIPQTQGLLAVLTEFNRLVTNELVYGEAPVTAVYDNFRLVNLLESTSSAVASSAGTVLNITVPRTDIEDILSVKKSSLRLLPLSSHDNTTQFNQSLFLKILYSASLIETYEKSYTSIPDVFYSDPLALTLTTSSSPSSPVESSSLEKVIYTIRHNEAVSRFHEDQLLSYENATHEAFSSNCSMGVANSTYFHCSRVPHTLEHYCNGSFHGRLLSYCPIVVPNCNILNVSTSQLVSEHSKSCEVIDFTRSETICSCWIKPATDSPADGRRRLDQSTTDSFISSGQPLVAATEYVGDDFIHVFSYQDELNSPSGAKRSAIMMGIIIVVWGGGFVVFFLFDYLSKTKETQEKNKKLMSKKERQLQYQQSSSSNHQLDHHHQDDLGQYEEDLLAKMKQEILLYIDLLIPAVYKPKESFLQRCLTEISSHHRYFHLFSLNTRRISSFDRFYRVVKVLSIQTLQMFIQAMLFDLQNPSDDGSCVNYHSEESCMSRKTVMDAHQSYCSWNQQQEDCSYADPQFSQNVMVYVMAITAICSALFKIPLDYCLKIWICPVYERDDFTVPQNPSAAPSSSTPSSPAAGSHKSSKVIPLTTTVLAGDDHGEEKKSSWWPTWPFLGCQPFFLYPLTFLCAWVPSIRRWRSRRSEGRNLPKQILQSHSSIHSSISRTGFMNLLMEMNYHQQDLDDPHHLAHNHHEKGPEGQEENEEDLEQGIDSNSKMKPSSPQMEKRLLSPEELIVKRLCEQIIQFRMQLKSALIQQKEKQSHVTQIYNKSVAQLLKEDPRWRLFNDQWGILLRPDRLEKKDDEDADEEEEDEDEDDYEENDEILEEILQESLTSRHSTVIFQLFEPTAIHQYLSSTNELSTDFQSNSLKFDRLTHTNVSIELMYLFIIDLLGKHTPAARIFHNKFNEDYPILFMVTRVWKLLMIIFVFLLNAFFLYFLLLKSVSKGIGWQLQFLQVNISSLVLEIFLYETIECLFLNYFIPESVNIEVYNAIYVLEMISENLEHFFLQQKHELSLSSSSTSRNHSMEFDASNYFFVSKALINCQPQLIESFLIHSYRNHYPGMICFTWKHYQKRLAIYQREEVLQERTKKQLKILGQSTGQQQRQQVATPSIALSRGSRYRPRQQPSTPVTEETEAPSFWDRMRLGWNRVKNHSFLLLTTISAGVFYVFQTIGLMPMFSQRVIIRLCQTTVLSGLTLLYNLPDKGKKYFLVAVSVVSFLVLAGIVRLAYRSFLSRRPAEQQDGAEGEKKTKTTNRVGSDANDVLRKRIDALKERFKRELVSNEVVATSEEQINLSEPIPMPCHHHTEVAGGNDDDLSLGHGGYPDDPIAASEFIEKPFSFGIFDDLTFELQKDQVEPDHFHDHRDEEELKSIEFPHNNESSPSTSQALDSPHPTKTSFLPLFHSPSSSAKIFTPKQQETIHRVTAGDPSLLFEMMDDHLAARAGHDEDNVSVLTNSSGKRKKRKDKQKQRTGGGGSRGLFMLPKRLIDQKIAPEEYQRHDEGKEENSSHVDDHSLVSLDEIYSVQYHHDQDDEDDAQSRRSKSSLTSRTSRRSRANKNGKRRKNKNKKKQQTADSRSHKTNVVNGNRYSLEEDDDLQSVISYSSTVKPWASSPPPPSNHSSARPPPGASNSGRESARRAPSQAQLNIHHRLNSLLDEDDEDEDSV